jgi:hypothetical protein
MFGDADGSPIDRGRMVAHDRASFDIMPASSAMPATGSRCELARRSEERPVVGLCVPAMCASRRAARIIRACRTYHSGVPHVSTGKFDRQKAEQH